jgi:hypothetical protein
MHELKQLNLQRPRTLAQTSLRQFNNELTLVSAEATGTTTFKYSGPISPRTRPFCRAHAGKIFTLDEIDRMDNGQGLPVRSSLGGWNCRHIWVPAPDATPTKKTVVQVPSPANPASGTVQVLMMDEHRSHEFFERERRAYVEAVKKFEFGADASAVRASRALAYAHDGFNEQITGQPSDGIWIQRLHTAMVNGKKTVRSNFEHHVLRRSRALLPALRKAGLESLYRRVGSTHPQEEWWWHVTDER